MSCGCGSPTCNSPSVCAQSSCETLNTYSYKTAIKSFHSWVIPACGGSAIIILPDVNVLPIGSYLWSSIYGYFEVITFNLLTHEVTILNHCDEGNAEVGVQVAPCSEFDVVDPPFVEGSPNEGDTCVAIDFTAPAIGDCVLITVTNIMGITAGDSVTIGTGTYVVDSVTSGSLLTICNEGDGLPAGTAVIAKNANGDYQYCLNISGDCCETLLNRFGGELIPCSDFEGLAIIDSDIPVATNDNIKVDEFAETNVAVLSFANTSLCRTLDIVVNVFAVCLVTTFELPADTEGEVHALLDIQEKINAGAFVSVAQLTQQFIARDIWGVAESAMMVWQNTFSVAPGATLALEYKAILTNNGTYPDPDVELVITDFKINAQGLGVAL